MKLDKIKYLKRVILICWSCLLICLIFKLFGFNIFKINYNNQRFKDICYIIDTNNVLKYIISFIYCLISLYLYTASILQKLYLNNIEFILILLTVAVGTFIKLYSVNIGWVFDIWQILILNLILIFKTTKKYYRVFIAAILLLIFQIISLITKDIGLKTLGSNMFIEKIN